MKVSLSIIKLYHCQGDYFINIVSLVEREAVIIN